MAEEHAPLAAPLGTEFYSAPIENLREAMGTLDVNDAEAEIEASKVHWSERKSEYYTAEVGPSVESLPTSNLEYNAEVAKDNVEVFRSLQKQYPGKFFVDERTVGPSGEEAFVFVPGFPHLGTPRFQKYGLSSEKPFAEGAQAELFYAHATTDEDNHKKKHESYVLKVFKDGTPLKDLVSNIPPIILTASSSTTMLTLYDCNFILSARLLKSSGRFAFLMPRAWGDLRKHIDMRKKHGNNPALLFSEDESIRMIYEIAKGMRDLHEIDTVHRDLKASNVLVFPKYYRLRSCPTTVEAGKFRCEVANSCRFGGTNRFREPEILVYRKDHPAFNNFGPITLEGKGSTIQCKVADYECSGGVVGTGFWRAPEILLGLKNRDYLQKPELFNKAADVYSFAMTCYEILSGDIPFEGWLKKDWDRVIGGERPILPDHTRPWMRDLVNRCWHGDPCERPTFKEIIKILHAFSNEPLDSYLPASVYAH